MKSILKSFIIIGFVTVSAVSFAQKTAFIELDSLLSVMPEMAAAKISTDHGKDLEATLTTMQKELNDKLADFQAHEKDYTDLIKGTKQKELQDLNQRIQDFQVQAQTDFQKKNDELTKPINEKAKKAIEKVAKAKGYKMVIDASRLSKGVLVRRHPTKPRASSTSSPRSATSSRWRLRATAVIPTPSSRKRSGWRSKEMLGLYVSEHRCWKSSGRCAATWSARCRS